MKSTILSFVAFMQLGAALTQASTSDTWMTSGLSTETDTVQASCTVGAGQHSCANEYSDVIAAQDKASRCPQLRKFVSCAQSQCSNSNNFQATYTKIDTYCNSSAQTTASCFLILVTTLTALYGILLH